MRNRTVLFMSLWLALMASRAEAAPAGALPTTTDPSCSGAKPIADLVAVPVVKFCDKDDNGENDCAGMNAYKCSLHCRGLSGVDLDVNMRMPIARSDGTCARENLAGTIVWQYGPRQNAAGETVPGIDHSGDRYRDPRRPLPAGVLLFGAYQSQTFYVSTAIDYCDAALGDFTRCSQDRNVVLASFESDCTGSGGTWDQAKRSCTRSGSVARTATLPQSANPDHSNAQGGTAITSPAPVRIVYQTRPVSFWRDVLPWILFGLALFVLMFVVPRDVSVSRSELAEAMSGRSQAENARDRLQRVLDQLQEVLKPIDLSGGGQETLLAAANRIVGEITALRLTLTSKFCPTDSRVLADGEITQRITALLMERDELASHVRKLGQENAILTGQLAQASAAAEDQQQLVSRTAAELTAARTTITERDGQLAALTAVHTELAEELAQGQTHAENTAQALRTECDRLRDQLAIKGVELALADRGAALGAEDEDGVPEGTFARGAGLAGRVADLDQRVARFEEVEALARRTREGIELNLGPAETLVAASRSKMRGQAEKGLRAIRALVAQLPAPAPAV